MDTAGTAGQPVLELKGIGKDFATGLGHIV